MFGAATSSACIIPVPLDREGAPVNHTPQILVDQSSPTFGRIRRGVSDVFDFQITVEDEDLARLEEPDTLHARFLRSPATGDKLVFLADMTNLAPVSDNPARVAGSFAALQYCGIFSNAPSTDLIVIVSDRPFIDITHATEPGFDPALSSGGATDRRQWILECQ